MSEKGFRFLCFVLLTAIGLGGLYMGIPYSGWVLFVGLLGVVGS